MSTRFQSIANIQVNQYMHTGGDGTEFQFRPQFITNKVEGEVALFTIQGVSGALYVRWQGGKIQQSADGDTWADTVLTEKGAAVNAASPAMVLTSVVAWTSRLTDGTVPNPEKNVILNLTGSPGTVGFLLSRSADHSGRFECHGMHVTSSENLAATLTLDNVEGDSEATATLAFIFKPGT